MFCQSSFARRRVDERRISVPTEIKRLDRPGWIPVDQAPPVPHPSSLNEPLPKPVQIVGLKIVNGGNIEVSSVLGATLMTYRKQQAPPLVRNVKTRPRSIGPQLSL